MPFLIGLVAGFVVGWLAERFLSPLVRPPERLPQTPPAGVALRERPVPAPAQTTPPSSPAPDVLTKIQGIGPVFAQRLNEAGVHTYADLARLTPERVREIVAAKPFQKIDPEAWIEQARQLAAANPTRPPR